MYFVLRIVPLRW